MSFKLGIFSANIGYGNESVFKNINLSLTGAKLVGIIGRNGIGKSTLLKTISGQLPMISGVVTLNSKPISRYNLNDLARLLSAVYAGHNGIIDITVRELISLGRTPYLNWTGVKNDEDLNAVQRAIETTRLSELAEINLSNLSDGERQSAYIARAIAQDTPFMILDEPTTHLDINNQINVLSLLKKLVNDQHKTILVSTHQIELALQLMDELWLLTKNGSIIQGKPDDEAFLSILAQEFKGDMHEFDTKQRRFVLKKD